MDYLEIVGTALGLLYLYLEFKANVWLWIVSIAMPAVYLHVYWHAGLYADFGISVYYILASVYGLVCWIVGHKHRTGSKEGETEAPLTIGHTPRRLLLPLGAICAGLWLVIGIILSRFTDSTVPWADAFTTALSITAMWMLARKYLEQWLVWLVADVACAMLYAYKELWFTAGLYLLYAIVAGFGYFRWKRMMIDSNIRQEGKNQ